MNTKKLIRKNKKNKRTKKRNTMSYTKKMKAKTFFVRGGLGKRSYVESVSSPPLPRKSARNAGTEIMPTAILGTGFRTVTDDELRSFVHNAIVENKPQIVDIPTPPERHAILIDVKLDDGKIMVSDWGGFKNETRGFELVYEDGRYIKNKDFDNRFIIYSQMMQLLREKYDLPIEYYSVDDELAKESDEHHETCNEQGGCSYYIYKWAAKYYPNYAV